MLRDQIHVGSMVRHINVLVPLIVLGVLLSTIGLVGTASGVFVLYDWMDAYNATGSTSAGPGSLAVASFFSPSTSTGAGAFSGILNGVPTSGLFQLTVNTPPNAPVLQCPNLQVSAAGRIVDGPLQPGYAVVSVCVRSQGHPVPGALVLFTANPADSFTGQGPGNGAIPLGRSIRAGFVAAGQTAGSGSAGPRNVQTAEAGVITSSGFLFAQSDQCEDSVGVGSGHTCFDIAFGTTGSIKPGCTLTTSGMTSFFSSFPNQPVTSTYTLVTCPPTSNGPQTARLVYTIGSDTNPVYTGTGTARMMEEVTIVVQ